MNGSEFRIPMEFDRLGKKWITVGALFAAIGVGLGAFGAHGLESWLPEQFPDDYEKRLTNWETAVRYQLIHAVGLILVGMCLRENDLRSFRISLWFFFDGIILFSGCLYGWVLTDSFLLVMLVPLGGVSLIVAWVALAVGCWPKPD